MMPIEPLILATEIGTPEVIGLASLCGLVTVSAFGLCYFVIKTGREERAEERATRKVEAAAMQEALQTLKDVATRRVG